MPTWLSPSTWEGIGVVSTVLIVAASLAWAVTRGWLILGVHHREVVAAKDQTIADKDVTIAALRDSAHGKDQTIATQAATISEFNVGSQLQAHMLESIRALAAERAS